MRNLWLVARHEYRHTVVRRGFVVLTLAVPLGMLLLVAMVILVENAGRNKLPVGYVDYSGILDARRAQDLPDAGKRIQVRPYPDEQAALAALEAGEIQSVFVFPAGYPETLHTDLYYLEKQPGDEVWEVVGDFVRINLVAPLPGDLRLRLLEGADITVYDTASHRRFSENDILSFLLPFVGAFVFFFATMMSAGYMLGVVAGEKEDRTIEILVTSMTPGQFIGGKTLGLSAAVLTQLAVYALAAVAGIGVASAYVPGLQQATVPWDYLAVMVLFFLPTYVLMSAIMIAIGSAVTEVQQGQQVAGLLNLLFMLPLFVLPMMVENPGNSIATAFTLFPTTAFLTISLRWALGTVPLWQLGASWVILVATASLMVWAAGRVFRVGMLRYGQPLNLKAALAAIQGR
jgi:ABC-2 type transport system permease protein